MKVTRREFMKYCSIAAGALGLTATDFMKLENAMALEGGLKVVWFNGQSCTGCTVSLANSMYYTTIQQLLLQTPANLTLDINFIETLSTSFGTTAIGDARAVLDQDVSLANAFVVVVEGAIPLGTPPDGGGGSNPGDFCTIWVDADGKEWTLWDVLQEFILDPNCVYVIGAGTCACYGGIPEAWPNPTKTCGLWQIKYWEKYFKGTFRDTDNPRDAAIVDWVASTACVVGDLVHPTTEDGRVFECIVAGTSGGSEPTWSNVTVDGTVTWQLTSKWRYESSDTYVWVADETVWYPFVKCYWDLLDSTTQDQIKAVSNKLKALQKAKYCGVVMIPGCPPNPNWIVGTIANVIVNNLMAPRHDALGRPTMYYGERICNNCDRFKEGLEGGFFTRTGVVNRQPTWIASNVYAALATAAPKVPNGFYYTTTAGGTSGATEPTWPTTVGATVGDGTVTWTTAQYGWFETAGAPAGFVNNVTPNSIGDPTSNIEGGDCLKYVGCKGSRTKSDCSMRKWHSPGVGQTGVNWCVGAGAPCQGCTQDGFPDRMSPFHYIR